MDCSMPGFPVHHQLPELTQTHIHQVGDAIQQSHSLSSPSPPASNLSQDQGLFQWVSSLHQVGEVLEFQLQHQSFQWIFSTDFHQDGLVGSPWCPKDSQDLSLPKSLLCLKRLSVIWPEQNSPPQHFLPYLPSYPGTHGQSWFLTRWFF